jgi:hypothetical protein
MLLELLELESSKTGSLGETPETTKESADEKVDSGTVPENKTEFVDVPLTKPKKVLTEKQREALKRGQEKRNANRDARAEAKRKEEEEKKRIMEEKLVKKAIAVKKKQIKRQEMLDEISDDETVERTPVKTPLQKPAAKVAAQKIPEEDIRPKRIIHFF